MTTISRTQALVFRLLLFSSLIFGLAIASKAANVTVGTVTIPNIQAGAGIYELRLWLDRTMVDSAGVTWVGGAVDSPTNYQRVSCSLASTTVTCSSFTLASTIDAQEGAQAKYTAKLYRNNTPLLVYNKPFALPASLGASVTWEQIWRYNNTVPNRVLDNEYYTKNQVNALYAGSIFSNPATTTSRGIGKSSVNVPDPVFVETTDPRNSDTRTPTDASVTDSKVAVGANIAPNKIAGTAVITGDTRLPTQGENDALQGTAGTPSNTNRYVTDGDTRINGALGWLNVRAFPYLASGNGSSNDTSAINAAIAACNAAGGGVIYLPRPSAYYRVTGALTTITAPCTVRGDGSGSSPSAVAWTTKIVQTSRTSDTFVVTGDSASFESLYGFNLNSTFNGSTVPATPPTAGSFIKVVASSSSTRVNIDDCVIEGFYDNVRQDGAHWSIHRTHIINPVRYGLFINNSITTDAGDSSINASWFTSKTYLADAMIRTLSSTRVTDVKINAYDDPAVAGVQGYGEGISADLTGTSVLLLDNVSIENYNSYAIHAANVAIFTFSNVQIADYVSAGTGPGILLTNCTDVNLGSVILRSTQSPTQVGIVCDDCTRVLQGSLLKDGFKGELQFTTNLGSRFTALTLATGWTNLGGPPFTQPVGYVYQNGMVCLRGLAQYGGGGTTTIATLPSYLWPANDQVFPGVANGAFQRIRIYSTTGVIQQEGGGPTTNQSLDGMCYVHN